MSEPDSHTNKSTTQPPTASKPRLVNGLRGTGKLMRCVEIGALLFGCGCVGRCCLLEHLLPSALYQLGLPDIPIHMFGYRACFIPCGVGVQAEGQGQLPREHICRSAIGNLYSCCGFCINDCNRCFSLAFTVIYILPRLRSYTGITRETTWRIGML